MKIRTIVFMLLTALSLAGFAAPAFAADALRPYVLASSGPGTVAAKLPEVKAALVREGFQVAGEYAPYKGAHLLAVTSDALKRAAARSESGGYGAVVRISLTETPAGLQIAYTNPLYYAQAYRMQDSLTDVSSALQKALGAKTAFGSEDGIPASDLRKYHYMVMMPYFTDQVRLASFGSQDAALKSVEAGLSSGTSGVSKVYRIDIPGKSESVFGVSITRGDGADAAIMKVIDTAELKHTAHLPYEMLVRDGAVYMLHGKFRIALDFPDLTMGTFMKISGAPGAIEDSLKQAATNK